MLGVDENDELIDPKRQVSGIDETQSFAQMIPRPKSAGVQQAHKEDRIVFTSLVPWSGIWSVRKGSIGKAMPRRGRRKRAAIFIGPEFGTVTRPDLVAAAKEAGDAGFDVLIACAFNYEAHTTEFAKLGRLPVLKARMNADLHMSEELKAVKTTAFDLQVDPAGLGLQFHRLDRARDKGFWSVRVSRTFGDGSVTGWRGRCCCATWGITTRRTSGQSGGGWRCIRGRGRRSSWRFGSGSRRLSGGLRSKAPLAAVASCRRSRPRLSTT